MLATESALWEGAIGMLAVVAWLLGYALAIPVGSWIHVLLHECGHVLATYLVGGRVLSVSVGGGRHVLPLRVLGVRWELRLFPEHGYVCVAIPGGGWFRARYLLVFLAGPAVTTALAWAAVTGFLAVLDQEGLWAFPARAALGPLAVVSALFAIRSWWPSYVRIDGQDLPSDALGAWMLMRSPPENDGELFGIHERDVARRKCWNAFMDGRYGDALDDYRLLRPSRMSWPRW